MTAGSTSFTDELMWTNRNSFPPLFSSDPAPLPGSSALLLGPGPTRASFKCREMSGQGPWALTPPGYRQTWYFLGIHFWQGKLTCFLLDSPFLKLIKRELINCSIFISWLLTITKGEGADEKVRKYRHFPNNGVPFGGAWDSQWFQEQLSVALLLHLVPPHSYEGDPASPAHFTANPAERVCPTEAQGPDSGGPDYAPSSWSLQIYHRCSTCSF